MLVPYYKAGLEGGEYCLWVTGGLVTDAIRSLQNTVPHADKYIADGQMEVVSHQKWYFTDSTFDPQKAFESWAARAARVRSSGYAGVRTSGHPCWLRSQTDWATFVAYEQEVQNSIDGQQVISLCTYSIMNADAHNIMGVYQAHHAALLGKGYEWEYLRLRDFSE